MKTKKTILIPSIIAILTIFFIQEIIPIINKKTAKNRVFNDMQDKSNDAIRGVVGIIPENDTDGLISHNGIGSGVIFDKKDNTYYVITAKHVLNQENSKYKIKKDNKKIRKG